jgi:hypothetical protein
LHNNVTGDSAYVVFPATMTFKVGGLDGLYGLLTALSTGEAIITEK